LLLHNNDIHEDVVIKIFQGGGTEKIRKKRIDDAEREANILAQINHKNIVKVIGTTLWENYYFAIILEYVPCGDLETFLLLDTNLPLPWKIRLRFFVKLADALDYIHNRFKQEPYSHGDLKPQNILLDNALTIKVADFGAASISDLTGATSTTIEGALTGTTPANTQHTPLYAAPELLKDLNQQKKRCCSMDVYSYGMIGYEIIARKRVYSGSEISMDALMFLIRDTGQKPNMQRKTVVI